MKRVIVLRSPKKSELIYKLPAGISIYTQSGGYALVDTKNLSQ